MPQRFPGLRAPSSTNKFLANVETDCEKKIPTRRRPVRPFAMCERPLQQRLADGCKDNNKGQFRAARATQLPQLPRKISSDSEY